MCRFPGRRHLVTKLFYAHSHPAYSGGAQVAARTPGGSAS